jgi:pimeloyl-ACP methyl ester carboxylesterase
MVTTPTALLVHGAFADAGSWSGVIAELQNHGIPVVAPPNPLRGLASDAACIASQAAQIDGPVVLVGHSYGGAVISVAGTAENVVGLVHVAAYIPEQGESLGELQGRFPLSPLAGSLEEKTYPVEGGEDAVEVTIEAEAFPAIFAADVPSVTEVLAVAQRPLAASTFTKDGVGRGVAGQAVLGARGRGGRGDQPGGGALRREAGRCDGRRDRRCLARRRRLPAEGRGRTDPRRGTRDHLSRPCQHPVSGSRCRTRR